MTKSPHAALSSSCRNKYVEGLADHGSYIFSIQSKCFTVSRHLFPSSDQLCLGWEISGTTCNAVPHRELLNVLRDVDVLLETLYLRH